MKKKDPAIALVLTLVTCGIYGIYWVWQTSQDLENEAGPAQFNPTIQLVLMFFYVGGIIFGMCADESLNKIREKHGMERVDNKTLYMIVGFFFFPALVFLVQTEINKFVEE